MTSSLVGSEMCIRDSSRSEIEYTWYCGMNYFLKEPGHVPPPGGFRVQRPCLLYTSDAADDM
eukprot:9581991-Prorocentrum_lima.AAC.1